MAESEEQGRLERLRERESLDEAERRELADLLVEAADGAGESAAIEREDEYVDELEMLADESDDPAVRVALAEAMANATDVYERDSDFEEACSTHRVRQLVDRLATLADERDDEQVTVEYARALSNLVFAEGEDEEFEAVEKRIRRLEELYDEATTGVDGDALAKQYARGLAFEGLKHAQSRENGGPGKKGKEQVARDHIESLYDDHPTDGVAAELAHILDIVSVTYGIAGNDTAQEETIEDLEALYEDHPTDEVADELIWALGIAAGDAGKADDDDLLDERFEQASAVFEDHHNEDTVDSFSRCYAELADVYFEERRNYPEGEEVLDDMAALYEEFPDEVASRYSLKIALSVRIYVEDGYIERAEDKLTDIEELYDAHPEDSDVEGNLGDAVYELVSHYIDEAEVEKAKEKLDHPIAKERVAEENEIGALDDDDVLDVAVLLEQVFDDETNDFVGQETRPPSDVPVVESVFVSLLLTVPVMTVYALLDPSLTVVTAFYPADGNWGLATWAGLGIAGLILLYFAYTTAGKSPPTSVYLAWGPIDFALVPTMLDDKDGSTALTKADALVVLTGLGLVALAFVDPVLWAYTIYGLFVWMVMNLVVMGVGIYLVMIELSSPCVTTRAPVEVLEKLERTPRECERLVNRAFKAM